MRVVETITTIRVDVEAAAYVARFFEPADALTSAGVRVRAIPEVGDKTLLLTVYAKGFGPERSLLGKMLGESVRIASRKAIRLRDADEDFDSGDDLPVRKQNRQRTTLKRRFTGKRRIENL